MGWHAYASFQGDNGFCASDQRPPTIDRLNDRAAMLADLRARR